MQAGIIRKRSLTRLAAPLFAAATALLASQAAQAAGTISYCVEAAPEGFDMAQYEAGATFDAVGITLYDGLVEIKPGTTDVVPGVAESWTVSPDGTQYTFKLRPHVKFHTTSYFKPTREMNADDVLFSFQRMNDRTHWAHDAAHNGFVYWEGMGMPKLVKSIEKIDDMTVRFNLTRPEAPFIATMSVSPVGPIMSLEYAEKLRAAGKLEGLNSQPIGTGPFFFRSYQKDAVFRMSANKDYWGGAPKIDQLVMAITVDPDVAVQRVKAGECQVAVIKIEAAQRFDGDSSVTIVNNKPLQTLYVAPNSMRPTTGDKRFREALWYAIDKANYIKAAYAGAGDPAVSFLPTQMWSHDATLKDRHDPDKARQLLKEVKYDGHELALFINEDSTIRRAAELLQSDWAAVGIKVRIQVMEQGEFFRRTGKGEHDLMLARWGSDNADPDNFFSPNLTCDAVTGGGNKSRWCNHDFDAALDAARRTTDVAARTRYYVQAQKILYDEVGLIPLVYPVRTTVQSKRVTGYVTNALMLHDFRNSSIQ